MGKVYKGGTVRLEPPPEGWSVLIFVDGLKAQVGGAKIVVKEGKEYIKFYLMPYDAVIKRFGIDIKKDLDENGYVMKWYPKEMVIPLNTFDPSRRIFFCMLDWDGKENEATRKFKGIEQADEINRLRRDIRAKNAQIEKLREENMILKTNVQKYIQNNIDGILKPLLPTIRSLVVPEGKE